jgi:hypothetical protein
MSAADEVGADACDLTRSLDALAWPARGARSADDQFSQLGSRRHVGSAQQNAGVNSAATSAENHTNRRAAADIRGDKRQTSAAVAKISDVLATTASTAVKPTFDKSECKWLMAFSG